MFRIRVKSGARVLMMVVPMLVIAMFIPPLRSILTLGFLPSMWSDLSTFRLLKVHSNENSITCSGQGALAPCTLPAKTASSKDPLQQLLTSEPYEKLQARPQDEKANAKAQAWIHQSAEHSQRYGRFAPKMTPLQKAQLLMTWRVVHQALTQHNITHYLIDGTLLGAIRHEAIIPWDDEIDVAVDEQDVDKVRRILSCIPGYTLLVSPCYFWKFFPSEGHIFARNSEAEFLHPKKLEEHEKKDYVLEWHLWENMAIRAPFVDLFFMTRDESFTWCLTRFNLKSCIYRLDDVYPLTQLSFEGMSVPAPRHGRLLVKNMVGGSNVCTSSGNDHFDAREITDISSIPCKELSPIYTVNDLE